MKGVWRWLIIILGALVALILLAAGALAYLVSRIDVRAEVERAIENATGRDVVIAGPTGVSFWPVLGLRAEDITIANVEGGRAPAFVSAGELDVGVELRPLLDRQVVVRNLVLQAPHIALEIDAQGRPNWVLTARPSTTPSPAPATPRPPAVNAARTTLKSIRISDGEVSYFDARRGAGWVVGDVELRTALDGLDRPMNVEGSVRYADKPITLALSIAQPGAAMRGQITQLTLQMESELLNASFQGQTIAASGEVAGLVEATGPSLRQLAAWTGAPIAGEANLQAFRVSGRLAVGRGLYNFTNAAFTLDRIGGRGDFAVTQRGGKPYISGRLELFDFDLNPYLTGQATPEGQAPTTVAEASAPTAQIAAVEAAPRALDVQNAAGQAPIDFSGLRSINADLELVTHAVLVQHMRVDASRLNLVLNDGFLAATLQNITLYGGSGHGRFEIDAREPATRMVQEFVLDRVDARSFLTDAINFSNIEGRAEVSLNLRARGATQSELLGALDGAAHIEVVSGTLHGVDLGGVARTIRNALRGELIAPEARTPFQGFSATFAIADGVLASDNLSFNTPDLRIPGIGVIDAPQRRLDLRLAPRSPRGGIVVPFAMRGPWTQISYTADISDRAQREILPRVRQVQAQARAN